MKRFAFLTFVVLCIIATRTTTATPSGWEYVYEEGERSQGFAFCDQVTNYVGVGTVYDATLFYRKLLVVDIYAWDMWPAETMWVNIYDSIMGEGHSILKVQDGFVIAGFYPEYTDSGGPHVLMVKIGYSGQVLWENHDAQGLGYSLTATPDGGYLVAGESFNNYMAEDLLLVKYDGTGDTLWTSTYGTEDVDMGYTIAPTSDGNYVVAGTKQASFSGQDGELWWLKLDQNGEILWEHSLGAPNYDYWGSSIEELEDGGFIIGGGSGEHGVEVDKNLVIIKTDAMGNILWTKEQYACLYFADPTPYWVSKTADGGYIATGMGFDFMKLDSIGQEEWKRQHTSSAVNPLSCCVKQTNAGRYVSIGEADSMFFMIDADENGEIWVSGVEETFSPSAGLNIRRASGQGIILDYSGFSQGFHASIFDASGRKVDEVRTASQSGAVVWGKCYGPGVYFIVPQGVKTNPMKVVLVR